MKRRLACIAALGFIAGCGGGGGGGSQTTTSGPVAQEQTQTQTTTTQAAEPSRSSSSGGFDPRAIYKAEAPGVVTLIALNGGANSAQGAGNEALGSGFVVDAAGYIATNAHVITSGSGAKANQVFVKFGDGNELGAQIVGVDLDSDVGLVKVDPSQLRPAGKRLVPVPFGSTAGLQVGDPVVAIGSPFGEQQSLSTGVVSALNRDIQSLTNFDIGNAIQTDAAINHGNSGGPLLNSQGKVIGINSQIRSTGGGGEGVGFAIPVQTVKRSVSQLRTQGHVDYAYLGISSVTLYPQLAERLKLKVLAGALIDKVGPGGPADKAGLRGAASYMTLQGVPKIPVGSDAIIAVDGKKLGGAEDLSDLIGVHRPGETVKLQIVRDGKTLTVDVKLGKRPGRGQ